MSTQTKKNKTWPSKLVNGFGALGYFFVALQWLLAFALYFTWISTYIIDPMQPARTHSPAPAQPIVPAEPEPLSIGTIVFLVVVVAVFIGITIYAMARIPKMVSSTGRKAARTLVSKTAPIALKVTHAPKTKKNILRMGSHLLIVVKVLAVAVPVVLAAATHFIGEQLLTLQIAVTISLILAAPATFFFAAQYIWAWAFRIPLEKIN